MNFKCSKLFAGFTWVLLGWGWAVWIEVWQVPAGSASVSGSGRWKWGSTASEPTFCQASDNRATAYVAWLPVQGGHDRKFVVYFKRVSAEDKRDEWQWSRLPTLALWIGFLVSWQVAKLPAEQLLCARRWGEGIFGQSGQKAPALHLPRFPRPGWRKTLPLLIILRYSHLKAEEAQVRRCTWCLWRWASSALATKFFVVFVLDTWTHQTLLVAQGGVRESRLQDLETKIWDQESEKLCDNSSNWSS